MTAVSSCGSGTSAQVTPSISLSRQGYGMGVGRCWVMASQRGFPLPSQRASTAPCSPFSPAQASSRPSSSAKRRTWQPFGMSLRPTVSVKRPCP